MYKIKKDLFYLKCCVLSFSQLKTANYSGLKGFTIELACAYSRETRGKTRRLLTLDQSGAEPIFIILR